MITTPNSSKVFNPTNWYWYVGGSDAQGPEAWSSAKMTFVQPDDEDFKTFLETGGHVSRILSMSELADVLDNYPQAKDAAIAARKAKEPKPQKRSSR